MENKLKNKWILMLLVGILLVVIAIPTTPAQKEEAYALEEEIRLKSILEQMEGTGNVKVMLTYKDRDEVEGVAIITDGAENMLVVKNITDVVQALFDVDSHKIKVMKGNQND